MGQMNLLSRSFGGGPLGLGPGLPVGEGELVEGDLRAGIGARRLSGQLEDARQEIPEIHLGPDGVEEGEGVGAEVLTGEVAQGAGVQGAEGLAGDAAGTAVDPHGAGGGEGGVEGAVKGSMGG